MNARRILVTGTAGAVGSTVARRLEQAGHEVRGFDRLPSDACADHRVGDLLDPEALVTATRGMDTFVHLAGVPERAHFADTLVPNNIVGTHHALEAARVCGVDRFVYASSVRVVGGLDWYQQQRIGLDAGLVPGDHYGITKATGELLTRMYTERFGFSGICARLGWFVRNLGEAEKLEGYEPGPRIYLSHDDCARFFERAVVADQRGFAAVFVASRESLFDLDPTKRLVGYEPRDCWPEGSEWSGQRVFASPPLAPSLLPGSDRD